MQPDEQLKYQTDAEKAINRAVLQMFQDRSRGFVTHIMCQLERVWDWSIPTAATDAKSLFINPKFFVELSEPQRISLLEHESWHVGYDHFGRQKERNHEKWNRAADFAINLDIAANGGAPIPGWLYDTQYDGMSAEQIYDALPDEPEDNAQNWQDIKPSAGVATANQVSQAISKAVTLSKYDGSWDSVPGHLQEMLLASLEAKSDWETLLEQHLDRIYERELSIARPNRRYDDMIIPGWVLRETSEVNNILWALDTSGSISTSQGTRFISECAYVHNKYECDTTTVMQFDTSVKKTEVFESSDQIENMEYLGRGGTSLFDVFAKAKQLEDKPVVMIVFSDLFCEQLPADLAPDFPVIWMCCDNPSGQVQFGDLVHFNT